MKIEHELEPFYNQDSKILILGTMPSVKSRELGFYYAHPKNRFWWVLSQVYQEELPTTIEDKKKFLKKYYIALFDVLKTCSIEGSSDASIKNPIPNDLSPILKNSQITTIFITGKKAYQLYQRYIYPKTKIPAISLPSTSPAYARRDIKEYLIQEYKQIVEYTKK